jgi:hypothetical protein
MAIFDAEIEDRTFIGRSTLLAKLERALKEERARGLARHWSYELARHAALFAVYRREREAFRREFGASAPPNSARQKPCGSIASGPVARPSLVSQPIDKDMPGR